MATLMTRLISIAIIGWAILTHPRAAACPIGWWVNGISPAGIYECRPVLGDPERDLEDAHARRDLGDERAIRGRIYCGWRVTPIVVDAQHVGCRS